MNIVSFSLFGSDPLYNIGVIRNSELMPKIFPEWDMWVYYDDTVPLETLDELRKNNVKLYKHNDNGFYRSMWRFYPCGDKNVGYFISRDADSRISIRDRVSVYEWIESDKDFHIIRDHPVGHSWVMNAGMWGAKGGTIDIQSMIKNYHNNPNEKYIDQLFLRDVIYPLIKDKSFIHDEYFKYEEFTHTIKRDRKIDDFAFIGESIDVNDESRYTTNPGDQRKTIIDRYIN
jgi:protein O-GlcNAc transferase